jgi:endonuclease/exonuclease/phosphatase family metal-dependent hydrolase
MRCTCFFFLVILLLSFFSPQAEAQTQRESSQLITKETTDTFRVLSWNIYMLPPLVYFTGKRKRAKAIGDHLASGAYDVIVFQEAFHHGARRKIIRRLKDIYPYRTGPAFIQYASFRSSSGVWMLSQHPIKVLGRTKFRQREGLDNKMARKGALMIEVVKNGQAFQIIGTHLNAGGSLETRTSQVRAIKDALINQHHKEDLPLIVAGDFNIRQSNAEGLDSMTCILNLGIYELGGTAQFTVDHTTNDLTRYTGQEVIDFMYFDPGLLDIKALHRFIPDITHQWSKKHRSLSDHNPIELHLQYRRR